MKPQLLLVFQQSVYLNSAARESNGSEILLAVMVCPDFFPPRNFVRDYCILEAFALVL